MLTLSVREWTDIRKRLKEEYSWKPSVYMISSVMRRELGFSPRLHRTYTEERGIEEVMCLDFYDDEMETLFRLKYL